MKYSRRKLRIHYRVGNDLGLWWAPKLRRWLDPATLPQGVTATSSRSFRTKRKAFGYAQHMGTGFWVVRFNSHLGHLRGAYVGWEVTEWEIRP
jgi:hypothetical protein